MSPIFDIEEHPHRRYNPLNGQWLLVSPHRTKRPWQGKQETSPRDERPAYDPRCYLCPGNERAGGARNPEYESTFVFDNDFAALLSPVPEGGEEAHLLLRVRAVQGTCRVICFSPRHDLSLAEMEKEEIRRVVDLWGAQIEELGQRYRWVQVFENKGEIMGCSNPHPHGQIWATDALPGEPAREEACQRIYLEERGKVLLSEYAELEAGLGTRVVVENEGWLAVVPHWALWPFETLLLPRRHARRFPELDEGERTRLADILKQLLVRYDNLFEASFPYSMGWHGAPHDGEDGGHWQVHAHFYPPLLRSATVKKFMVGYEMLAEPQRDLTPEQAAARLRDLPGAHYKGGR